MMKNFDNVKNIISFIEDSNLQAESRLENRIKFKYDITDLDENELWNILESYNDNIIKYYFVMKYRFLAYKFSNKFIKESKSSYYNHNEIISAAFYGLIDSVNKFTLSKKCKFITYAYKRVYGSILDVDRKNSKINTKYQVILDDDSNNIKSECNSKFDTENVVEKHIISDILNEMILYLSDLEKVVIKSYYYDRININKVSKNLSMSNNNVIETIDYALVRLRIYIEIRYGNIL